MSVWTKFRRLLEDPPPAFVFEISHAGIAFARRVDSVKLGFRGLEPDVLAVSPLRDNVLRPEAFQAAVRELAPPNGNRRRRRAALILPDYSTRVAVLDFDKFPSDAQEQLSLVRFRVKKSIPFDLDSAAIGYHVQAGGASNRKVEVVAAIAALEIVARYEAPFRASGMQPGFITTSALASLDLLAPDGIRLLAKLSGTTLTVSVVDGRNLKLMRCVELAGLNPEEVMAVVYPTFAYVEDELRARPASVLLCGFESMTDQFLRRCQEELGVPVEPLRSRFGEPDQNNAGLLGYLEAVRER